MANLTNKDKGRAIADIRGVYFYNHTNGEPAINTALLADSGWYSVLTLRGTVNCSQDAPSVTAVHVDQFDPAIGITAEPGDFTFEAFLPSMAADDLAKWLDPTAKAIQFSQTGEEKRYGYGYNLDGKLYDRTVLIQTRTGDIFIFARAQLSFSFGQEDKTFGFRLSGQVLAATYEGNSSASPAVPANKMVYLLTNVGEVASSQII